MSLRRNIIANYLGHAWVVAMGLAFVPLYIRHLGMEAYGLIGLFALMQAWLALLDVGMTPTLAREMARFTSGGHSAQSIRNLLRSLEMVSICIAAAICFGVWAASDWLAGDWLKAEAMPVGVVAQAIGTMALVIALRFVEGIYRSALFGLQRQVWYNLANALLATLRGVGAVGVLTLVSPTIEAFFLWQAVVSLLSVAAFAFGVYRALPTPPLRASFSSEALLGIWRFAGGMMGITFLAILLTQVDKVLLSRLLTLEDFGYYALAATISGALYLIITPVTTAFYPRLVELASLSDRVLLGAIYHRGAQLVTVLVTPAALVLTFFGEGVLFAWSGDADLALRAGPILSALSLGNLLNGLMYMPYQLQLAHGWTTLAFKINIVAVALLVPAIFWIVPRHGALGAAAVWIGLNTGYVLIAIHLMHRRILPTEKRRWYWNDVSLPMLGAVVALLLLYGLRPDELQSRTDWFIFLALGFVGALAASGLMAKDIRTRVSVTFRRAART